MCFCSLIQRCSVFCGLFFRIVFYMISFPFVPSSRHHLKVLGIIMKTEEKREAWDVVLWRQIIDAVNPECIKTCQQQRLNCFVYDFFFFWWNFPLIQFKVTHFDVTSNVFRANLEFKCRTFPALTLTSLTHFHPLSPAIWDLWSIMFANPQFELCNYVNTVIFASCYEILWPEPSVAE